MRRAGWFFCRREVDVRTLRLPVSPGFILPLLLPTSVLRRHIVAARAT